MEITFKNQKKKVNETINRIKITNIIHFQAFKFRKLQMESIFLTKFSYKLQKESFFCFKQSYRKRRIHFN